jgi:hypothetical protein
LQQRQQQLLDITKSTLIFKEAAQEIKIHIMQQFLDDLPEKQICSENFTRSKTEFANEKEEF